MSVPINLAASRGCEVYAIRWGNWGWAVVRPSGSSRKEGYARVEKFLSKSKRWTKRITVPLADLVTNREFNELEEKDRKRLRSIVARALQNW